MNKLTLSTVLICLLCICALAQKQAAGRKNIPATAYKLIALKVTGGRAPFTWMVDGAVIGSYGRYDQTAIEPGEGFSRITVIDADGNSATSRVRFKAPKS